MSLGFAHYTDHPRSCIVVMTETSTSLTHLIENLEGSGTSNNNYVIGDSVTTVQLLGYNWIHRLRRCMVITEMLTRSLKHLSIIENL